MQAIIRNLTASDLKVISAAMQATVWPGPGGFTHWFDGKDRTTGYVVSDGQRGKKVRSAMEIRLALHSVIATADRTRYDGIGTWTDETDGAVYVDCNTWVARREDALLLAGARGEIAIWDLAASEAITVEYSEIEVSA
jgi:hypothetical protein